MDLNIPEACNVIYCGGCASDNSLILITVKPVDAAIFHGSNWRLKGKAKWKKSELLVDEFTFEMMW